MKRVLSIALAILLILSAIPMFTFADTLAQTVYYAKVGGTGDGKTYETAADSIKTVINTINGDGHKAGDKVTVYLDSRVDGATPTVIDSASKVLAYCGTNMPDYTCEITFTPHPDLVASGENLILGYMEYGSTGNNRMHIGGPTVFENLTLLDLSKNGSWWAGIYNRGKSVTYRNVNFLDLKSLITKLKKSPKLNGDYLPYQLMVEE